MELYEKTLNSTPIYDGAIIRVRVDQVELENGRPAKREVVDHVDGVTVLPLDDQGNVYMVRQFRYPFGRTFLELPAGKLDPGEDALTGAVRELREETGLTADTLTYLGGYAVSPGFCTETLHIYLARGLHSGQASPDEDEFLAVERYPLDKLYKMVLAGEIADAKTAIGILQAQALLSREK